MLTTYRIGRAAVTLHVYRGAIFPRTLRHVLGCALLYSWVRLSYGVRSLAFRPAASVGRAMLRGIAR